MSGKNNVKILLVIVLIMAFLFCGKPGQDEDKQNKETAGSGQKDHKTVARQSGQQQGRTTFKAQKPGALTPEQKQVFLKAVAGKRLGIIDVGMHRQTPAQVLDMVTVFLSEQRDIQLVERTDLEEVLKEHALQLAMTTETSPDKIIRLGQLTKADALLMFETGNSKDNYTPIRLRLVDTHFGFKVWDDTIFIKKNLDSLEADLNIIIDRVIGKLQNLETSRKLPIIIGISQIRSIEFQGKLEWLGNEIAAGIERYLATRPGVLLVERHRTRPLVEERHLVPDLPASLQAAALLVEGTCRWDRDAGENMIKLSLLARTQGEEVLRTQVSGSISSLSQLCRQAADILLEKLKLPTGYPPMHPEQEAMFLVKQARIFLAINDPEGAIPPAQSALALAPRLLKPKVILLRAINQIADKTTWTIPEKNIPLQKRQQSTRYYIPLCLQSLEAARQMLESPYFPPTQNWRSKDFEMEYSRQALVLLLNYRDGVFAYPHILLRVSDCPETRESLQIMAPIYRDLYRVYLRVTDVKDPYYSYLEKCLEDGIKAGRWWFSTPQQVIPHIMTLIQKADETKNLPPLDFECVQGVFWPTNQELHRQYLDLLYQLSNEESPMMQTLAQRCYSRYYFNESPHPDQEASLTHYERFVHLLEKEIIPRFRKPKCNIGYWADINNFPIPEQMVKYHRDRLKVYDIPNIARLKRRAMEAFLSPGSNDIGWRLLMRDTVTWCEHAGQSKEMIALLKRCRQHLDEVQVDRNSTFRYYKSQFKEEVNRYIRELRRRHPELEETQESPAAAPLKAKVLLKADSIPALIPKNASLPGKPSMVGMVKTDNQLVILCADSREFSPWGREHMGILRLEPGTRRILGYRGVGKLNYYTNQNSHTFNINSDHGPRSCTFKDDVFVGLFDSGILWFPSRGEPLHLNQGNGLVSQDIVSSMTVLNNNLYALVRESSLKWALMEVDLKTRRSRILISPQGSDDEGDLQRMSLRSIISEPGKSFLLINAIPNGEESFKRYWGLYRYNPAAQKAQWLNTILPGQFCRMQAEGSQVLLVDREKVGMLPAVGQRIKWYYLINRATLHWPTRPGFFKYLRKVNVPWRSDEEVMKCVLLEDRILLLTAEDAGLFPSSRRPPYRLLYFKQGQQEPLEVKGKNIPPAEKIVDMMRMGNQALLLTHDTLYSLSLM